MTMLLLLAELM